MLAKGDNCSRHDKLRAFPLRAAGQKLELSSFTLANRGYSAAMTREAHILDLTRPGLRSLALILLSRL
jgi:hypothetical protein